MPWCFAHCQHRHFYSPILPSKWKYLPLQKAHLRIFILVHFGLAFCRVRHEDSKNLYGNVKMCVGICMGACVRAKQTSLFDGYFWTQSLCLYGGGKIAHSTSLTLDFITQGTDKRREGKCFSFSLSFSLHPPFHSPSPLSVSHLRKLWRGSKRCGGQEGVL